MTGLIEIDVDTKNEFIHWNCNKYSEEGRISDWENTKWDNRDLRLDLLFKGSK